MSVGEIINTVINAVLIVASIVVAVLTWGAATPAVLEADEAVAATEGEIAGLEAAEQAALDEQVAVQAELNTEVDSYNDVLHASRVQRHYSAAERVVQRRDQIRGRNGLLRTQRRSSGEARRTRIGAVTKAVAKTVTVGAVASGPASLGAQAAAGEHISSSDTLNSLLIQPMTAVIGMAASAGIGIGVVRAAAMITGKTLTAAAASSGIRLVSYTIGAAGGAALAGAVSSAAQKEDMGSEKTWENIGIGAGVAAGVALITAIAPFVKRGALRVGRWLFARKESSGSVSFSSSVRSTYVDDIDTVNPSQAPDYNTVFGSEDEW
jgi:hypothetical protein